MWFSLLRDFCLARYAKQNARNNKTSAMWMKLRYNIKLRGISFALPIAINFCITVIVFCDALFWLRIFCRLAANVNA